MKPTLKYRLIEQCSGNYPIAEMCTFFAVSRSGYYRYLKNKNKPARDADLGEAIAECQKARGKIHGYRYVHLWLERHKGIHRNPKTVLRVMRKYGLLSEVRRKRWHRFGQSIHRYENLLNRNFMTESPNRKWVTDISYIPTAQGFLYLSVIRDLFDNSIVAYQTSRQQTVTLVLDTVHAAMAKEKVTGSYSSTVTKGFNTLLTGILTLPKNMALRPRCQDVGTLMTMLWQKISFPYSRPNASQDRKSRPLNKRKY